MAKQKRVVVIDEIEKYMSGDAMLNGEQKRHVLAAILAYTNMMGRGNPDAQTIRQLLGSAVRGSRAVDLVIDLARPDLESEEMGDHFENEALHWFKRIRGKTDTCLAKAWPPEWAMVNGKVEYRLVDDVTGNPIKLPAKRKDFRGDTVKVIAFTPPSTISSTGRVTVLDRGITTQYYPSVVGARILLA
jgi:hypothetical protein